MKLKQLMMLLVALPMMAMANTAPESPKDIVTFSTEVEKEVERDLMKVSLYMQEEGTDFKTLSKKATDRLNEAVVEAKKQSAVKILYNNQTTRIRYDNKGKKNGWISRVDITLQSKSFDQISQIIANLNDQFVVDSVNFSLSSELQKSLEDEMLTSALAKFTHQAELIQKSLNAKSYKIERLSLNNADRYQVYERASYVAAPMAAKSYSAEVQEPVLDLESGKAKVRASVDASIQLVR